MKNEEEEEENACVRASWNSSISGNWIKKLREQ